MPSVRHWGFPAVSQTGSRSRRDNITPLKLTNKSAIHLSHQLDTSPADTQTQTLTYREALIHTQARTHRQTHSHINTVRCTNVIHKFKDIPPPQPISGGITLSQLHQILARACHIKFNTALTNKPEAHTSIWRANLPNSQIKNKTMRQRQLKQTDK